jgi:DNA primase
MPRAWSRLAKLDGAQAFNIGNAMAHIRRRGSDPWQDVDRIEQSLPRSAR